MRYWVEDNTLVIEGPFEALSSGLLGGWRRVEHVFNHTVSEDFDYANPVEYLRRTAEKLGLRNYFGLLTSVPMDKLAIVSVDDVTAFVTAGVINHNEKIANVGTINIVVVIEAGVSEGGMVNAVITATEAKSTALLEEGHKFTGTNTDAVVIAKTGGRYYEYAGPSSELGRKIWRAVKEGVKESLGKW
ncbi:adenosylcobinamide amidohydrolase [Archaeoglobus veneficus]|uniref:Adenosylcobinamide amidohydrolase n=1 Tax=Archaeoglobus veneficus (strain DSM 11195 / SNP6) TaxID=693661 RepID=F2KSW9_ARCVS|nr:adenosylcobinamide amidohydrolase [Archaeoglobus veneficus]AEA47014.1 protein of unknown function DUF105 [Archaeoglobus veneficus SNP6]